MLSVVKVQITPFLVSLLQMVLRSCIRLNHHWWQMLCIIIIFNKLILDSVLLLKYWLFKSSVSPVSIEIGDQECSFLDWRWSTRMTRATIHHIPSPTKVAICRQMQTPLDSIHLTDRGGPIRTQHLITWHSLNQSEDSEPGVRGERLQQPEIWRGFTGTEDYIARFQTLW